jgi:hypothetical protein
MLPDTSRPPPSLTDLSLSRPGVQAVTERRPFQQLMEQATVVPMPPLQAGSTAHPGHLANGTQRPIGTRPYTEVFVSPDEPTPSTSTYVPPQRRANPWQEEFQPKTENWDEPASGAGATAGVGICDPQRMTSIIEEGLAQAGIGNQPWKEEVAQEQERLNQVFARGNTAEIASEITDAIFPLFKRLVLDD